MKKDTLEEKILREFDGKFKEGVPPMRIHNSGSEKSWIEHPEIKDWLRTTLTSYRNDVLEEVLDKFRQCADDLENSMTTIPVESTWNSALRQSSAKIHALIKSLKVDIIKR